MSTPSLINKDELSGGFNTVRLKGGKQSMINAVDLWRSDSWSPARELSLLQRGIDRIFDDMLIPFSGERSTDSAWKFNPACDVEETDSHYMVSFDLPGISKDDVKIEITDNQMTVSGERKSETREKGSRHVLERFHGAFQRSFTLPASVDSEHVEATYNDGVLRIAIPKAEAAKPRRIEVTEGKGGLLGRLLGKDRDAGTVETTGTKHNAA
jgi:HSP20 family protein